jgi:hypothetical protein
MLQHAKLDEAKRILAKSWPLHSFIATNPLWNLRDKAFLDALKCVPTNAIMDSSFYKAQYLAGAFSLHDITKAYFLVTGNDLTLEKANAWLEKAFAQKTGQPQKILYADINSEYEFQNSKDWIQKEITTILIDYFSGNTEQPFTEFIKTHNTGSWKTINK